MHGIWIPICLYVDYLRITIQTDEKARSLKMGFLPVDFTELSSPKTGQN